MYRANRISHIFVFGHLKCNRSPSLFLGRRCALIIAVTLGMEFSSLLAFTVSKRAPQPSSRVCRGRFPGVLWHSDICKVQPSLALLIFPSPTTYSGKSWWLYFQSSQKGSRHQNTGISNLNVVTFPVFKNYLASLNISQTSKHFKCILEPYLLNLGFFVVGKLQ